VAFSVAVDSLVSDPAVDSLVSDPAADYFPASAPAAAVSVLSLVVGSPAVSEEAVVV